MLSSGLAVFFLRKWKRPNVASEILGLDSVRRPESGWRPLPDAEATTIQLLSMFSIFIAEIIAFHDHSPAGSPYHNPISQTPSRKRKRGFSTLLNI